MNTHRVFTRLLNLPPVSLFSGALVFGLGVIFAVIMTAIGQPWLGLKLAPAAEGNAVSVQRATGPSEGIPRGTVLVRIVSQGEELSLEALDTVAEPDGAMGSFANYHQFLQRQGQLATMLRSGEVTFVSEEGVRFPVIPEKNRPLGSLPVEFWVQVIVGLIAWLVSSSVFAFRTGDTAARYLLLSGLATLTFAPLAAIYSTRELALPETLFLWLNDLNFLGGSLFTASFVALLLHYPRRIAPNWVGIGVVLLFLVWYLLQQSGAFQSMTFARRFLVMIGVVSTFALAAVHWFRTGTDPVGRASLQWFLMAWMLGTLGFAFFILLPQLFGVDTSALQGYAFLLFLLVYGGLAFGILRYRLFELGDWWRRIAVWSAAVLVLIVLDLIFVMRLHLSSELSLSLALVACGLLWLPLRACIWGRLGERQASRSEDKVGRIMQIALTPPAEDSQLRRWRSLLQDEFDPLQIEEDDESPAEQIHIVNDGLGLRLPAVGTIAALRLDYPKAGRGLFTPRDAARAKEMVSLLGHAIESRSAYEKGVQQERGRIARDMHDNLGAQLLTALRSGEAPEKDTAIRQALSDLRDVINDLCGNSTTLEEALANLRLETAERLDAADIRLEWTCPDSGFLQLPGRTIQSIRAVVREAVSNTIRHAAAKTVSIAISTEPKSLVINIKDDGCGIPANGKPAGNGLTNMQTRIEMLDGELTIAPQGNGARLTAKIPWQPKG